jgi:YidC/Oxa1 family membrane protein insertase
MQAIRERHKADPVKMQQATMELYKSEKINPLGGCLPILIQMPVFLALYWVLQAAVEMRGASWLWIPDLTAKDPIFVLPILYAISMFVTTRLNPQPAAGVLGHLHLLPVRPGAVLGGEQPDLDGAAVRHHQKVRAGEVSLSLR